MILLYNTYCIYLRRGPTCTSKSSPPPMIDGSSTPDGRGIFNSGNKSGEMRPRNAITMEPLKKS